MCKLFIAVKKVGENKELKNLMYAQYKTMEKEKDGCGALIIKGDGQIEVMRCFYDYESVYRFASKHFNEAKFISIHTRTGTSGEKSIKNVHFFNSGGYYFAHNGWVGKYHKVTGITYSRGSSSYSPTLDFDKLQDAYSDPDIDPKITDALLEMESCRGCWDSKLRVCKKHKKILEKYSEKNDGKLITTTITPTPKPIDDIDSYCDSYQFLMNIEKPLTPAIIEASVEPTRFSGMGVFIADNGEQAFLTVHKQCYGIKGTNYSAFTSFDPDTDWKDMGIVDIAGVTAIAEGEDIHLDIETMQLAEGSYEIKLS